MRFFLPLLVAALTRPASAGRPFESERPGVLATVDARAVSQQRHTRKEGPLYHRAGNQPGMLMSEAEHAMVSKHVAAIMKSYENVLGVFNDMALEWWLCDGNQIGALRWGHMYGSVDEGILRTDDDMDFMVKADSLEHWDKMSKQLMDRLTGSGVSSHCTDITDCRMKISCCIVGHPGSLDTSEPPMCDHADIHGYVVNETGNYASSFTASGWPFGHWHDKAPYRGLITDEKGRLAKARFGTLDVNVAHSASEMATHWNIEEYGGNVPLFPDQGAMIHKWGTEHEGYGGDPFPMTGFTLTENDKANICQQQALLSDLGYATFDYKSQCKGYLGTQQDGQPSVNISRARTKDEVLAGTVLGLDVPGGEAAV